MFLPIGLQNNFRNFLPGKNVSVASWLAACVLAPALCFAEEPAGAKPNAIVAADGSGDFKTVQEGINKAPQTTSADKPWIILVKPGTYKEIVYVQREKHFIHLVGEDAEKTVITYNLSAGMKGLDGMVISTFRTPTLTVDADDFTVENLTIENSAGPVGQALALRADGDRDIFLNCRFNGSQDTIFLNRGRQYFENCTITGAVDFIFGGATAFFEKCHLISVGGYVTAASTPAEAPFGFVFSNCTITAGKPDAKVLLGRPWRPYASTIFLNTEMSDAVTPAGWSNWGQPDREKTARYAEYHSTGPGATPDQRVPWAKQLSDSEAKEITVERVFGGWNPTAKAPSAPAASGDRAPVTSDIEYGRADGEPLLMDAGIPAGPGPHPVAIIVHGGGWCSGDKKTDINGLFEPLTKAGFVWFSINYRLAPAHRWPACFEDVKTAIRWVKAHSAEFNGDPNRIALIGYSAGGHLVACAADMGDDSTRVQAVVGFAPAVDLVNDMKRRGVASASMQALLDLPEQLTDASLEKIRAISPFEKVKPGMPPFLLIQGTVDKTVPPDQTAAFAAKLRKAGVPCEEVMIAGAGHRLREWDNLDPSYMGKLVSWLQRQLPDAAKKSSN